MADTLIEQTRALHEDAERLERVVVKDLKQEAKSHREKLMQSHRVRKRLEGIQESSRKLIKIYDDEDKARKEEIDALGGEDKVFSRFYDRLKEVREYHRRFPNTDITEAENDSDLLKEEPYVEFTGEEGPGRFLDLHEHFHRFLNSKFGKQMDYVEYTSSFMEFAGIPKGHKYSKAYREYLGHLQTYLESFYERTQPLAQLQRQLNKVAEEFPVLWDAGALPGWEDRGQALLPSTSSGIDLEAFDSPEELETTIGADRLKEALQALGLKCGGTLRERAERLFLTKGQALDKLDKKHFAKGVVPASVERTEEEVQKELAASKQIALLEAKINKMADLLSNVIADTRARVEKKQGQTYEEMQAEAEEAEGEGGGGDDDEEEDEFIYNPLKLPLGWDGKPIPYWLYKLHGLNQEFKCEICGNNSYWGRRAFEKHFKEFRHQNGMRALGIPNNKMFYEVTKMDEAVALWRTIQERGKGGFRPDVDEEFEDAQGNVYNRKTYEDLKRQGLI